MAEHQATPLENFVLPEKAMSLKLVFDNVRNYVIIGALVGLAIWLDSSKATVPPIFNPDLVPERTNWWLCLSLSAILFFFNGSQTYFIIVRLLRAYLHRKAGNFIDIPNLGTKSRIRVVVMYVAALILSTAVTVVIVRLILLALYIAWFAATRGGS